MIRDNFGTSSASKNDLPVESRPPLRVLLADDHAVVREGVKTLVNLQSDMQVVGEAESGEQVRQVIRNLIAQNAPPDVVVMDVSMPDGNGVEATMKIRRTWPTIKVLALSMHEDRSYLRSLLEAGAAGYVLKRSAAAELIRAIRTVADGGSYLDPALAATVMQSLVRTGNTAPVLRGVPTRTALSEREETVLRLIAQGYANKEIAVKLKVSVKTVETYKARSMEKLSLDGRAELVRYALAQGWLS